MFGDVLTEDVVWILIRRSEPRRPFDSTDGLHMRFGGDNVAFRSEQLGSYQIVT